MPFWSAPIASDQKTLAILGDSGIILGLEDDFGCRWRWESNDPWSPSPAVRSVTGDRATGHGSWDATRFYGPRRPEFKGTVVAPTHEALHVARQRLFDAITVEQFPLRIIEPGFDRYAMVRREGEVLWTEMRNGRAATWSLSLAAPDPVIRRTQAPGHPPFPVGTTHVFWNEGGLEAWPHIYISGAQVPTMTIANTTTGESFTLTHPTGGNIAPAGHTVDIDMDRRTVKVGGVNRRSWMTGGWWGLRRRGNHVYLSGLTPGPGVEYVVAWQDGWI